MNRTGRLRPANVIFIEDSVPDIDFIEATLELLNIEINMQIIRSGEELTAYFNNEGKFRESLIPDLILLDLSIPGMDSWEILRKIKADKRYNNCPVFIFSGSSYDKDISQAKDYGVKAYLTKPFEIESFTTAVSKCENLLFEKINGKTYLCAAS